MVSISNLIKCMIIFTLFLCCQIQGRTINDGNNNEELDISDAFWELFPSEEGRFDHQPFRRASLRYHPHILYKKASLKPIIRQNGKLTFSKRDSY